VLSIVFAKESGSCVLSAVSLGGGGGGRGALENAGKLHSSKTATKNRTSEKGVRKGISINCEAN